MSIRVGYGWFFGVLEARGPVRSPLYGLPTRAFFRPWRLAPYLRLLKPRRRIPGRTCRTLRGPPRRRRQHGASEHDGASVRGDPAATGGRAELARDRTSSGCSRRTVREVRDGERLSPDVTKAVSDPL